MYVINRNILTKVKEYKQIDWYPYYYGTYNGSTDFHDVKLCSDDKFNPFYFKDIDHAEVMINLQHEFGLVAKYSIITVQEFQKEINKIAFIKKNFN